MADPQAPSTPTLKPGDPLDLATSVAGEEDPGASLDLPMEPAKPAGQAPVPPPPSAVEKGTRGA